MVLVAVVVDGSGATTWGEVDRTNTVAAAAADAETPVLELI